MDIFKLLIKLLVTLLLIASFGCDSEAYPWNSDNDDPNNVCKDLGRGVASCENNVCKDPSGEVVSCNLWKQIGPITVTGKTPDGLPGTFYVETEGCPVEPENNPFVNVTSFELKMTDLQIGDEGCVYLQRDKHLFVYYLLEIKDGDKNATFSFDWSAPNSWGLAPNGLYLDETSVEKEIDTVIIENKVHMTGIRFPVPLNINTFQGKYKNEYTDEELSGTISDDLKTIQYHLRVDGDEFDTTLTLKE